MLILLIYTIGADHGRDHEGAGAHDRRLRDAGAGPRKESGYEGAQPRALRGPNILRRLAKIKCTVLRPTFRKSQAHYHYTK